MAKFRLETVLDPASGLFYAEVYYPEDAATPFTKSEPRFTTHEQAAQHGVDTLKKAFPNKPIKATPA